MLAGDPAADTPARGSEWVSGLRHEHRERSRALEAKLATAADGTDGLIRPNRLLGALQKRLVPDALDIAFTATGPVLLDVLVTPEAVSSDATLGCGTRGQSLSRSVSAWPNRRPMTFERATP